MRAPQAVFGAAVVVTLSMVPQLAEAGPCSSDIAELETTVQFSGKSAWRTRPAISQRSIAPTVNAGIGEMGR
jgi:hypothetical protein